MFFVYINGGSCVEHTQEASMNMNTDGVSSSFSLHGWELDAGLIEKSRK